MTDFPTKEATFQAIPSFMPCHFFSSQKLTYTANLSIRINKRATDIFVKCYILPHSPLLLLIQMAALIEKNVIKNLRNCDICHNQSCMTTMLTIQYHKEECCDTGPGDDRQFCIVQRGSGPHQMETLLWETEKVAHQFTPA